MADLHLDNFLSGSPSIFTDSEEGQLHSQSSLVSGIGVEEKSKLGMEMSDGAVWGCQVRGENQICMTVSVVCSCL